MKAVGFNGQPIELEDHEFEVLYHYAGFVSTITRVQAGDDLVSSMFMAGIVFHREYPDIANQFIHTICNMHEDDVQRTLRALKGIADRIVEKHDHADVIAASKVAYDVAKMVRDITDA